MDRRLAPFAPQASIRQAYSRCPETRARSALNLHGLRRQAKPFWTANATLDMWGLTKVLAKPVRAAVTKILLVRRSVHRVPITRITTRPEAQTLLRACVTPATLVSHRLGEPVCHAHQAHSSPNLGLHPAKTVHVELMPALRPIMRNQIA